MKKIKKIINKALSLIGYEIIAIKTKSQSMDKYFLEKYNKCKPYTMTDIHRMYATYQATNYILKNDIKGSFVECGVWKGGNTMLMALTLKRLGEKRNIWLYDTFQGMSKPTKNDKNRKGKKAEYMYKQRKKWCYSSLEEVRQNMMTTNYNQENIYYIKGKVENTLKKYIPKKIALLRLDTDFYKSTKKEMEILYPKLAKGGVLIIDDYDVWQGARKAVNEYFSKHNINPLLHLTGNGGRMMIKK